MHSYQVSYSSIASLLLVLLVTIFMSPFLSGVLLLNTSVTYYLTLLFLFFLIIYKQGLSIWSIFLTSIFTFSILILVLFTQSQVHFNRYIFQGISILLCFLIVKDYKVINKFTTAMTIFALIGIFCSAVGFIYSFYGGQPIGHFENIDGRPNFIYLTTFSNAIYGNIIRPSFIYDEPGAFSFVLCFVVILRELMKRKSNLSFLIMFCGLITFSLAHVIIFILYALSKIKISIKSIFSAIFFSIIILLSVYYVASTAEFSFFTDRFIINKDGDISGDNRMNQLDNFERVFNWSIFWGGDYKCHDLPTKMCVSHGDISSSIVTPLYTGGVIQLFIQIVTHIVFIFMIMKNKKLFFPVLAMSLLLLQRPFFGVQGYLLMIYIIFFISLSISLGNYRYISSPKIH